MKIPDQPPWGNSGDWTLFYMSKERDLWNVLEGDPADGRERLGCSGTSEMEVNRCVM